MGMEMATYKYSKILLLMGNTHCSDTCSNCTCLSLTSYEGAECTRLLKGEQTTILLFFGILIMFVVFIVYFGCIKFNSYAGKSYGAQFIENVAGFLKKEVTSKSGLISWYAFAIGAVSFLTALIWRQYENMDYDCTTSEETDIKFFIDGIDVFFYIFIGVLVIIVLEAFYLGIRLCLRKIRA